MATDHVAEAERLIEKSYDAQIPEVAQFALSAAQVHATLALVATLTRRDARPEPHSAAWCNARDRWDTVESGRRFDDLDPEMQAALAARWQALYG